MKYVCPIDGCEFQSNRCRTFEKHHIKSIHYGIKTSFRRFVCSVCNKSYYRKKNSEIHEMSKCKTNSFFKSIMVRKNVIVCTKVRYVYDKKVVKYLNKLTYKEILAVRDYLDGFLEYIK